MSLRDLVTGSDGCTADVAGPSNAIASLADSLLSDKQKVTSQVTEFPTSYEISQQDFPQTSGQHVLVQDAFVSSKIADNLNVLDPTNVAQDILNLQSQNQHAGNLNGLLNENQIDINTINRQEDLNQFEQIWSSGAEQQLVGLQPGIVGLEQEAISLQALEGIFREFVVSGQQGRNFQPLQLPPIPLNIVQQCKVRDRATIMSRQLFSELGDEFADQQVSNLLGALNIDPKSLPAQLEPIDQGQWNQVWSQQQQPPQPQLLPEVTEQQRYQQQYQFQQQFQRVPLMQPPPQHWINQFSQMNLNQLNQQLVEPPQQEQQQQANWVNEFQQQSTENQTQVENQNGVLENSKLLKQTMESHQNEKLEQSQFYQFISKLSHGELQVKDSEVVQGTGSIQENQNQQFQQQQQQENEGQQQQAQQGNLEEDWTEEFMHALDRVELGDLGDFQFDGLNSEQIHEQFQQMVSQYDMTRPYEFAKENKYVNAGDALALAKRLYAEGDLREAALAAEGALQNEIEDSKTKVAAWRLLGSIHAENDDDLRAISALAQALKLDPTDLDTLLSLGVSHTNQLDQSQALQYLTQWLQHNPNFDDRIFQRVGPLLDQSQRESYTERLFEEALLIRQDDPDVLTALGVLRHLRQDFDGSIDAFQRALQARPEDHSLWNKLGAAMANGGKSGSALETYRRALELKPNYLRAIANLGISHSNLGDYNNSYLSYLQALRLNPNAESVWEYLRCGLLAAGKVELMGLVDNRDIDALSQELATQG